MTILGPLTNDPDEQVVGEDSDEVPLVGVRLDEDAQPLLGRAARVKSANRRRVGFLAGSLYVAGTSLTPGVMLLPAVPVHTSFSAALAALVIVWYANIVSAVATIKASNAAAWSPGNVRRRRARTLNELGAATGGWVVEGLSWLWSSGAHLSLAIGSLMILETALDHVVPPALYYDNLWVGIVFLLPVLWIVPRYSTTIGFNTTLLSLLVYSTLSALLIISLFRDLDTGNPRVFPWPQASDMWEVPTLTHLIVAVAIVKVALTNVTTDGTIAIEQLLVRRLRPVQVVVTGTTLATFVACCVLVAGWLLGRVVAPGESTYPTQLLGGGVIRTTVHGVLVGVMLVYCAMYLARIAELVESATMGLAARATDFAANWVVAQSPAVIARRARAKKAHGSQHDSIRTETAPKHLMQFETQLLDLLETRRTQTVARSQRQQLAALEAEPGTPVTTASDPGYDSDTVEADLYKWLVWRRDNPESVYGDDSPTVDGPLQGPRDPRIRALSDTKWYAKKRRAANSKPKEFGWLARVFMRTKIVSSVSLVALGLQHLWKEGDDDDEPLSIHAWWSVARLTGPLLDVPATIILPCLFWMVAGSWPPLKSRYSASFLSIFLTSLIVLGACFLTGMVCYYIILHWNVFK